MSPTLPWYLLPVLWVGQGNPQGPGGPVQAVAEVDLSRYVGKWYEIARFPNRFQKQCVGETTAEYALRPDGSLRVVNQCVTRTGDTSRAEGSAHRADKAGPVSKLKVRFAPRILSFLPFVWGDYWILDLDPDYTVALVGTPSRDYLWVLARSPQLDEGRYQQVLERAAAQGFDIGRLVRALPAPGGS